MTTRPLSAGTLRPGYTFVELVLVLLICSVLMAAAVPRYSNSLMQFRVESAAKRVAADIVFAQRQALVQGKSQAIQFTPDGGTPGIPNTYAMPTVKYVNFAAAGVVVDLTKSPYQVKVNSASFAPGTTLTFDRYGVPSSAGSVVVAAGSATKTVNVSATTGRVTIP